MGECMPTRLTTSDIRVNKFGIQQCILGLIFREERDQDERQPEEETDWEPNVNQSVCVRLLIFLRSKELKDKTMRGRFTAASSLFTAFRWCGAKIKFSSSRCVEAVTTSPETTTGR